MGLIIQSRPQNPEPPTPASNKPAPPIKRPSINLTGNHLAVGIEDVHSVSPHRLNPTDQTAILIQQGDHAGLPFGLELLGLLVMSLTDSI
jgi:hypothetical protein